jgi:RNA polymerase sigma factor (sigma-70 family)
MHPVLLVDDDVNILYGLQQLLELEQIGSATAIDATSASELITSQFFPLILADLRLRSETDGLELIERVSRLSPRSKVVAMSGFVTPAIEARARQAGAETVLQKPFDTDEFLTTIRSLLSSSPAAIEDDEAIYRATTPRLRAMIARRYQLSRDESEDVLQQAWCVLLERRNEVRDVGAFLAGTVMNLSRQTIQRNVRELDLDSAPEEQVWAQNDVVRLSVQSALARLDERSRQLCSLIGLEQLNYAEVSERLSIPLGSVGPLYMRAKERLRRELTN